MCNKNPTAVMAFVTFYERRAAETAKLAMDGKRFLGSRFKVGSRSAACTLMMHTEPFLTLLVVVRLDLDRLGSESISVSQRLRSCYWLRLSTECA